MSKTTHPFRKPAVFVSLMATALVPFHLANAETFNANVKFAFKAAGGTPMLDGAKDSIWDTAPIVHMEDGGTYSAGTMRGMTTASDVFLLFDVEDKACDPNGAGCPADPAERRLFDESDMLVIAFNVNNTPSGYRRIVISPCDLNSAAVCPTDVVTPGQEPFLTFSTGVIDAATGIVAWTQVSDGQGSIPGIAQAATRTEASSFVNFGPEQVATTGRWQVEVKLNRAGLSLPGTGFFGFFADAVSVSQHNAHATQYTWPSALQVGSTPDQAVVMAADQGVNPAQWGTVTLDATQLSGGLQITGFYSNQTDPTKIALNAPNQLFANVAHYPTSAPPPGTASVNAQVRFRIANFGLNPMDYYSYNNWANFPSGGVPTAPRTINTGSYVNFSTPSWQPDPVAKYPTAMSPLSQLGFFTANTHQCIEVAVLDPVTSNPIAPVRQFNMDFKQVMSPFTSQLSIAPRAWLKMTSREPVIHLRELVLNSGKARNWKAEFDGAERISANELTLKFNPRSETVLKHSVLADRELRLDRSEYQLSPKTAYGRALNIPVKGGTVISLFAEGATRIGDQVVPATGLMITKDRLPRTAEVTRSAMLTRAISLPRERIAPGAVTGSFDGFKTSFLIGATSSIQVPRAAKQLSVRIEKGDDPNIVIDGDGFKLGVIATPVTKEMISMFPALSNRRNPGLIFLPIGFNLPTYMVRGELQTGYRVRIGKRVYKSIMPMGSFGHMVNYVAAQ